MEDLIPGGETYRTPENLHGLQWWGDVCIIADIDKVKAVNPQNGKETVLFTRETVNRALKAAGLKELSHLYNLKFPWAENTEVLLPLPQRYAVYNWHMDSVTGRDDLPKEPAANYDYNTASHNLAYTVKNNLYVNGQRVTNEPEGIVCGQSVHRNEFGISKGTFWSPSGRPACLLSDERKHGHPLSAGGHHVKNSRNGHDTLPHGRHAEPRSRGRYL